MSYPTYSILVFVAFSLACSRPLSISARLPNGEVQAPSSESSAPDSRGVSGAESVGLLSKAILHYPFDEIQGDMKDFSRSGLDAVVSNVTQGQPGKVGLSAYFSGNALARTGTTGLLQVSDFSVAVWIRMPVQSARSYLFDLDHYAQNRNFTVVCTSATTECSLAVYDRAGGWENGPTVTVPPNSWRHLVFTKSGAVTKAYLDGRFLSVRNFTSGILNLVNTRLCVGALCSGESFFHGWLDEIVIFDRALTDLEITLLYERR